MAEYFGTRGRTVKSAIRTVAIPFGLLLCLLLPALGIFSWQTRSAPQPEAAATADSTTQLLAPSYLRTLAAWSERSHSGSFSELRPPAYDPFATVMTPEMILAQGDPFLLALASGQSEGRLTVKERVRGIAVLGPPTPKNRAFDYELDAVRHYAGGSFGKFFASIFGESGDGRTVLADSEIIPPEDGEENPFLKAREALEQNETPPDTVESAAENTPPEPAAADDPAPVETTPPVEKTEISSLPVVTVRPNLMLRMVDGILHTGAAGNPRANTFESAEWGVQEMALLPFAEPTEFPTSIAVADFNGDLQPDVAFHVGVQGLLRFFYGASDGSYTEGLRIDVGRGPRSVAAGDFNRDGRTDLAVSTVGAGVLTLLFGNTEGGYDFKASWVDTYRDYILAADTAGSGFLQVVGMNFANRGNVLVEFEEPQGKVSDRTLQYAPALQSKISTTKGRVARINAVALGASLSLNLDSLQNNLVNVANIAAGMDVYLLVGDLNNDGSMIVGIARPR